MLQTLIYIPHQIAGIPLFGFGILLAVWALLSIALVAWLVRRQGFSADTRAYLPVLLMLGLAILFLPRIVGEERGLPIRGYGVMLLLAVSSAVMLLVHRAKRRGYDPEMMFSLSFWLFVSGILGARVFYVIEYWDRQFQKDTIADTVKAVLNVSQGGLVVFGSLIGGAIAALIFIRKYRLPTLVMADLMAPSIVLGMAIGRIGCFFNGCCHGGQCDLPWAVQFPWGSPPHLQQVEEGTLRLYGIEFDERRLNDPALVKSVEPGSLAAKSGLRTGQTIRAVLFKGDNLETESDSKYSSGWKIYEVRTAAEAQSALMKITAPGTQISLTLATTRGNHTRLPAWTVPEQLPTSLPIHPAQLYSAIDGFLLFVVLLAYEPFQRRNGELLALMLTLHPISRFLLEIVRTDEAAVFGTGLSISQNISLIAFVGSFVLWAYIVRQPRLAEPSTV